MTVAVTPSVSPRRTLTVCGGAHALHDGFTDLLNVLYPLLQAQFGLSYAAIGAFKTVYSGAMAVGQIPSGKLAVRFGGVTRSGDRHGADRRRLRTRGPHRLALRRGHRAAAGRTGRQHAASDRLQPGVGRLLRPALAHRARHLQFHRRRRQGAAAGLLRVDRRFAGLAAGVDHHRRDRRPRGRHHPRDAEASAVAQQGRRGQGRGRTGPTVGLLAPVLHPHRRRPGAHRLPDLSAVPLARQRRRHPDDRSWPVAAVRGRCRRQAGDGLGRRRSSASCPRLS